MAEPTLLQQARKLAAEYRNAWPGSDVVDCILQHLEQREAAMRGPAQVPAEPLRNFAPQTVDCADCGEAEEHMSHFRGADRHHFRRGKPYTSENVKALIAGVPDAATTDAFAGWLDELQRLCDRATGGPWFAGGNGVESDDACIADVDSTRVADAAFIAAARDALPKLIAEVRLLEDERDGLLRELRHTSATLARVMEERNAAQANVEVGDA